MRQAAEQQARFLRIDQLRRDITHSRYSDALYRSKPPFQRSLIAAGRGSPQLSPCWRHFFLAIFLFGCSPCLLLNHAPDRFRKRSGMQRKRQQPACGRIDVDQAVGAGKEKDAERTTFQERRQQLKRMTPARANRQPSSNRDSYCDCRG